MTIKPSTLPTLPPFGRKYAQSNQRLPLCQHYKINNILYYYIDIWQSMYQCFMINTSNFIVKLYDIYKGISLYRYGKLGNLANFGVYDCGGLRLRQKTRWQTFGKLGKLQ